MIRANRRGSRGFTLLELMIVIAIIGLLVSMGIFTFQSTLPRIRFRNDARALSAAIQLARLRAISTGIPHGIAFQRQLGALPDRYFIFMDCAGNPAPDFKFTGTGNLADNKPITTLSQCNAVGLLADPQIKDQGMQTLSLGTKFGPILGSLTAPAPDTSKLEYIAFNTVGQAVQGPNLAVGGANEVIIEHTLEKTVYQTGVTLTPGTGLCYTFAMRKK